MLATTDMPGSSRCSKRLVGIERDPDRDALHDLGEIAGGVVRRSSGELRTGAGEIRSTRPRSFSCAKLSTVRSTVDRLTRVSCVFLVIRDHIDIRSGTTLIRLVPILT